MTLNNETIKLINLFELVTGARVKDCFAYDDRILFIVNYGEIGRVVANRGSKIKKLEKMIKKKVKVVEYSDDLAEFLKSYISPMKVTSINVNEKLVEIKSDDTRDRGILIGRDRKNIENLKKIVKKYFDIIEIKVV